MSKLPIAPSKITSKKVMGGMTYIRTFLRNLTLAGTLFLPSFVSAQSTSAPSVNKLGAFLQQFITLIDYVLVPLLFAIAFIVFIFGIFQYFILGGANEEKRETGRTFMLYGIIGFFIMISVWGIVNLLLGTFSFGSSSTRPGLPTFGPSTSAPATNGEGSLPASDAASGSGGGSVKASDAPGGTSSGDCTVLNNCAANEQCSIYTRKCVPKDFRATISCDTPADCPTNGTFSCINTKCVEYTSSGGANYGGSPATDCRQNDNLCNGANETCSYATGACVTTSSSGSGGSSSNTTARGCLTGAVVCGKNDACIQSGAEAGKCITPSGFTY